MLTQTFSNVEVSILDLIVITNEQLSLFKNVRLLLLNNCLKDHLKDTCHCLTMYMNLLFNRRRDIFWLKTKVGQQKHFDWTS